MGIFITERELAGLKNAPEGSRQRVFCRELTERTRRNTREDALVQSSDTQEWYHLCWERFSDASFVCMAEGDAAVGQWLYKRTMEIVRMDEDRWLGPWFRGRSAQPSGFLETSHITMAVCEAIANCPFLFTDDEKQEILTAIREKGMKLCERYCEAIEKGQDTINNWFMVLLNGFGTAAVLLGDEERIRKARHWARLAGILYNRNDYGESVQYSNYASLHLAHLNEVLIRSGCAQEELDLDCYTRLMEWYAASFLYNKPLAEGGERYPRSFNFGDSAAIFRPTADLLAHIAVRCKDSSPRQAGLAAWMFETMYENPALGPDELATFGFFNQYQYHTILMLPDMAVPLSPIEAGLPETLSFEGGQIISRDRWENADAAIAIQAGYGLLNVNSHRHHDQNSFQLAIGNERMLIDPGHCCYRLQTQRESASEMAHNTISVKKKGQLLEQKAVGGNIFRREDAGNRLLCSYFWKHVQIVGSDASGLYAGAVEKAVRYWVMDLPHMMFVIDVISAKEEVSVCAHFCANNRDGRLQVHQATEQRLVLRRGGRALKLFEAYAETDGKETASKLSFNWTAMHDYYHPLPNQAGQGKEGSVCRYLWEGPEGKEHVRIHTFLMDESEAVKGWHVYHMEDGYVRMESPDKKRILEAKLEDGCLLLRDETGECHKTEDLV